MISLSEHHPRAIKMVRVKAKRLVSFMGQQVKAEEFRPGDMTYQQNRPLYLYP
jgi:hypothetical protein